MAISFADSLKAAAASSNSDSDESTISTASTDTDTETETASEESTISVMSLSVEEDDESTTLVSAASVDEDEEEESAATVVLYASSTTSDDEDDSETWTTSSAYLWYDEYEDDNVSEVDELKNITVDDSQINLTQETNSQYIPFVMNRYYDGVDLSSKNILIHYVTSQGSEDYASPINVSYSSSQIKFGWLVSSSATAYSGDLEFEIQAIGTTSKGDEYIWKTKPNGKLNILASLDGDGVVEPDSTWITSFLTQITEQVALAQTAVNEAEAAAEEAQTAATEAAAAVDEVTTAVTEAKAELETAVDTYISTALDDYYTKTEVDGLLEDIDLTAVYEAIDGIDGLANFNVTYDSDTGELAFYNGETVIQTVTITLDPSAEWTTAYGLVVDDKIATALADYSDALDALSDDVASIHTAIDDLPETLATNYYTIEAMDELLAAKADQIDVDSLTNDLSVVENSVSAIEESLSTMSDDLAAMQTVIDSIDTSDHNEYEATYVDNIFTLYENGEVKNQFTITGGSGGSSESTVITIERITSDTVTAISGDTVLIEFNFSSVDTAGDTTGDGTATWTVGSTKVATSTVTQGDNSFDITSYLSTGSNTVKLSVTDSAGTVSTKRWTVNLIEFYLESTFDDTLFYSGDVTFRYTPYGSVEKTIYFVLDGETLGTVTTSVTGRQATYTIAEQSHGAHLLEVYMTATVNDELVTSDSIYKDIIWVDSDSTDPIISCATTEFTAKQYNTTSITYTVYDPQNNPATVILAEDGETISTLSVSRTSQTWAYKSSDVGTHTLTISCGDVSKTITATIEDLGIDVEAVTTNLELDFNPSGYSNSSEDRFWTDGTTTLSVSDDFDWENGGYQIDDDGDTYFCVRAGTTAEFDYNLFADDAKQTGKTFKFIFKATNVKDYDGAVMSCYSGGIGFEVNAQVATLYSEQNSVTTSFREDNFIELELQILPDSEYTEMLLWTDGIPLEVVNYASSDSFTQTSPVPITIGSEDCDVWVYRMKAYSMNLTDDEMLDNFIADAKNAEEMIDRYTRNQIVNANGEIDPDVLAENCPDLRVIKISAPTFTTGKKNEVSDTTVQHIYKGGREVEDNWTATGSHKGQGTSSEQYGESGRNIDINMSGGFVFGDDSTGSKYAMTENSVPEKYFNIKVNIASSENANNAVLADDYNTFNPYIRTAKANDSQVRDTMEFHPCVIFIQETDTTNATVFTDGQWHFYACGDFGNSKKNSDTMGMDADNHQEFIIEIDNNTDDQTRFLSDDLSEETWDGDHSFEFRYSSDDCTDDELQAGKDAWQEVLTWVVNATPETFVAELEDHFVKESLLYFYLFTERHTMVDNRAKNVFVHTEDLEHWDFCFDYDNDLDFSVSL